MTIPAELKHFKNEDDFIQKFLMPLLRRMGFSLVNYHGVEEMGCDLILCEIDRFGEVRYLGVQAKYESSIGKKAAQGLIDDCNEAFSVPFAHPTTNAKHRISTFYAVNAGDISAQTRKVFYETLQPKFGDNARLFDGKALLILDRWASINKRDSVGTIISGISVELYYNEQTLETIRSELEKPLKGEKPVPPLRRLRDDALKSFLSQPISSEAELLTDVLSYAQFVDELNRALDVWMMRHVVDSDTSASFAKYLLSQQDHWAEMEADQKSIIERLLALLRKCEPLSEAPLFIPGSDSPSEEATEVQT